VKTVSHGLAGGTISHLQGGKFGHGFVSAAGSAATAPLVDSATAGGVVQGAIVTTLVGGTLSRLSGGKFANGALTAAMSYAFSSAASRGGSGGEGEWIYPEGGSTNLNDYDTEMTNGILGDRDDFINGINRMRIPGYFNPSHGFFAERKTWTAKIFDQDFRSIAARLAEAVSTSIKSRQIRVDCRSKPTRPGARGA
jgi:hypothetical protein